MRAALLTVFLVLSGCTDPDPGGAVPPAVPAPGDDGPRFGDARFDPVDLSAGDDDDDSATDDGADDDDSLSLPDTEGTNSSACDDCQGCGDTTGLPTNGSYSLSWLGLLLFGSLVGLRRRR